MVEGLVDQGVNNISGIEFRSSKADELKSEARKKAIEDARKKALDFTGALGQQLGAAYMVTDNSPVDYPRPVYEARLMAMAKDAVGGNEGVSSHVSNIAPAERSTSEPAATAVPEPSAILLALAALVYFLLFGRRRRMV